MAVNTSPDSIAIHARAQKRAQLAKMIKTTRMAWMYIAPAGLLMLVISFFPQIFQIWMAFTDYRIKNLRFQYYLDLLECNLPRGIGRVDCPGIKQQASGRAEDLSSAVCLTLGSSRIYHGVDLAQYVR
jgi:ABC-type sugar transport system permease subunit